MFCFPVAQCEACGWNLDFKSFKNFGRRPHGETSCELFRTLREPDCQTKWKAVGCRSCCLAKISVYFGHLTHHFYFTELPLRPLGKVRVPICSCHIMSYWLHGLLKYVLQHAKQGHFTASQGEVLLLVPIHAHRNLLSGIISCLYWLKM